MFMGYDSTQNRTGELNLPACNDVSVVRHEAGGLGRPCQATTHVSCRTKASYFRLSPVDSGRVKWLCQQRFAAPGASSTGWGISAAVGCALVSPHFSKPISDGTTQGELLASNDSCLATTVALVPGVKSFCLDTQEEFGQLRQQATPVIGTRQRPTLVQDSHFYGVVGDNSLPQGRSIPPWSWGASRMGKGCGACEQRNRMFFCFSCSCAGSEPEQGSSFRTGVVVVT